jgi:hypothetical protein
MVVTKKMKIYLGEYNATGTEDNKLKIKHCVYMNRMHKRIDRELFMGVWLAQHRPDIFRDEGKEHKGSDGKLHKNARLKMLIDMILAINPKMDLELVLKNMPQADKPTNPLP